MSGSFPSFKHLSDKIRILFVDDEISLLQLSKTFMEREDERLEVETASSAINALELLEKENYNAIVSDYQMPSMDGLRFLETLRSKNYTIPFIIFTGRGREEVAIKALNLGANRYIQKGGDPKAQYGVLTQAVIDEVEHKRAEEALVESQATQAGILKVAPVGIGVLDGIERTFTWMSDFFLDMIGYSREELLGKNVEMLYQNKEDYKRVGQVKYEEMRRNGTGFYDTRLKCKDGLIIDVVVRITPIDSNDLSKGVVFAALDITDRKQAEKALRQSEERFRAIVEKSDIGTVILDNNYTVIYVNDAYCTISGYSLDEYVGQDFRLFLSGESKQQVADYYIRRQRGEDVPVRYEFDMIRKDGQKRRIQTISTVFKDTKGSINTLGQIIDITERKQLEQELYDTNLLLETIFDHTHIMVAYLDPQFNFIRVNQAYALTDEKEPDDFIGKNHFDLYPNEENEKIFCNVIESGSPHFSYAKAFEYVDKPDRGVTYWDWSLVPIKDAKDSITALILTLQDVTIRVKAELELIKKSKEHS
ncbi:MAG: PAS domain S-box protein, partial [Candidatus Hodarchaeales archaeon]